MTAGLRLVAWGVAALGFSGAPVVAQGPGTEGPIVLQTPASVRSAGLNGGGAALVGDAGAVFTNPAGLATIRHVSVEGGYQAAALDAFVTTAAVAWRVRQFHLGFGVQRFDFGEEPEVVPDPSTGNVLGMPTGGVVGASEALGVGSLVYRFGLFALGGSVKYLRQNVAGLTENGIGTDLGFAIAIFDLMALGFAVQNVGGNLQGGSPLEMPGASRAGFTMNYVDPQESFRLLSTVEMQWLSGRDSRLVFGVEGGIVVGGAGVVGRIAYGSRPEGSDRGPFTYGATLELGRMNIDFAYEPNDLIDDPSRRIGIRLSL